jgi:anti-sigma B factor antagonist
MSLEIVHAEREGVEILTLHGQLTLGPEDLVFRRELTGALHAGTIRVVLNITDLQLLDSTGLGTLLFAAAEVRKAGGNLAIFNTHPAFSDPPEEAQLQTTMPMFSTEQDAVDSFFPGRAIKHYDILDFVDSLKR